MHFPDALRRSIICSQQSIQPTASLQRRGASWTGVLRRNLETRSKEMANFLKTLFDKKPRVQKVDIARRFELLARVGQRGMAKVWLGPDGVAGKDVAIKGLDQK